MRLNRGQKIGVLFSTIWLIAMTGLMVEDFTSRGQADLSHIDLAMVASIFLGPVLTGWIVFYLGSKAFRWIGPVRLKKNIIAVCTLLVMAAMVGFPPWTRSADTKDIKFSKPVEYGSILNPPDNYGRLITIEIDFSRLGLQFFIVCAVAGALTLVGRSGEHDPQPDAHVTAGITRPLGGNRPVNPIKRKIQALLPFPRGTRNKAWVLLLITALGGSYIYWSQIVSSATAPDPHLRPIDYDPAIKFPIDAASSLREVDFDPFAGEQDAPIGGTSNIRTETPAPVAEAAPLSPVQVQTTAYEDLGRTAGFMIGQRCTLKKIEAGFPDLAKTAGFSASEFDLAFGKAEKAINEELKTLLQDRYVEFWEHLKTKVQDGVCKQVMNHKTASDFVAVVLDRSKGDIPSPMLETLLTYQYRDNPLGEFARNYVRKFSTKNHPKANDVELSISYPESWKAAEGERPHIVQKFISENGRGLELFLVEVKDLQLPAGHITSPQEL